MMEIAWDEKRCGNPDDCKRCLDACPQGVFYMYPKTGRVAGRTTEDWAIGALFLSLCTGCGICSDLCPNQAIRVAAPA